MVVLRRFDDSVVESGGLLENVASSVVVKSNDEYIVSGSIVCVVMFIREFCSWIGKAEVSLFTISAIIILNKSEQKIKRYVINCFLR